MRRTLMLAAVITALSLVAGAYAATASDRINPLKTFNGGIEPASSRVGDQLRYELTWTAVDRDGRDVPANATFLVTVEGPGDAVDRYGIIRAVDHYLVAVLDEDVPVVVARCSALRGGGEVVRIDYLEGEVSSRGFVSWENYFDLLTTSTSQVDFFAASAFGGDCPGRAALPGGTLREGDNILLAQAAGIGVRTRNLAETSQPAVRTEFEGRRALTFTFPSASDDASEGAALALTYADGIPGVASAVFRGTGLASGFGLYARADEAPLRVRLVGFIPGDGVVLSGFTGAALPETNPQGLVAFERLRFDDTAFAVSYPYDEAFAAVASDPTLCVADIITRGDAYLRSASFDADERDPIFFQYPTEGGWHLDFRAGETRCEVLTVRLALPVPGLPGPRPTRNYFEDPFATSAGIEPDLPKSLPERVAPSLLVADLIAREGQEPTATNHLSYFVYDTQGETRIAVGIGTLPTWGPRESGTHEGRYSDLELVSGGLSRTMTGQATRVNELGIDDGAWGFAAFERSRVSALSGPEVGQGLALGLIAGATLLALLIKSVLVPFYTRLSRDALLENPIRARLYEQTRREPGVHQAALVDYAGIGKSATVRHLERLVKARFLAEIHDNGLVCYYAVGEVPPEMARRAAILRSESLRRVYELYRSEPDVPLREAARRLGVSAPSVHRAKKKLEEAGLLPAAEDARIAVAA